MGNHYSVENCTGPVYTGNGGWGRAGYSPLTDGSAFGLGMFLIVSGWLYEILEKIRFIRVRISGFIIGLFDFWAVLTFLRYPKVLCTPSAVSADSTKSHCNLYLRSLLCQIPEFALLMADLSVAAIHPFSGSAALRNGCVTVILL